MWFLTKLLAVGWFALFLWHPESLGPALDPEAAVVTLYGRKPIKELSSADFVRCPSASGGHCKVLSFLYYADDKVMPLVAGGRFFVEDRPASVGCFDFELWPLQRALDVFYLSFGEAGPIAKWRVHPVYRFLVDPAQLVVDMIGLVHK